MSITTRVSKSKVLIVLTILFLLSFITKVFYLVRLSTTREDMIHGDMLSTYKV
jgi:hypothetical protein